MFEFAAYAVQVREQRAARGINYDDLTVVLVMASPESQQLPVTVARGDSCLDSSRSSREANDRYMNRAACEKL